MSWLGAKGGVRASELATEVSVSLSVDMMSEGGGGGGGHRDCRGDELRHWPGGFLRPSLRIKNSGLSNFSFS